MAGLCEGCNEPPGSLKAICMKVYFGVLQCEYTAVQNSANKLLDCVPLKAMSKMSKEVVLQVAPSHAKKIFEEHGDRAPYFLDLGIRMR
ncbi:hypothetical protein ANN_03796 [Periplaneta americana]|uniref:Uncharacterized protein n=1 Tax=Periplaneta americana TaxID=6978 RepID=A0ABQ8TZW9_PERAM|nr:hypothetical protein ANN_03796 [Periplaneta americana]